MTDTDNIWNSTYQANAVNVHWGASKVLEYYTNVLGRNNIDGAGLTSSNIGPLSYSADGSTTLFPHYVNYLTNYTDVTYTPSGIFYGTGDGINYGQVVSLDIIGHEMFHGALISNSTLNASYPVGQTGALQEAWCDIFGAMAERYVLGESNDTWKIGENFYTPNISGDSLRRIDYPPLSANITGITTNGNPDHMLNYYNGTGDNQGVHINCGIPSKAFYLLAKGGQHPNGGPILQGLGTDVAASIWYRAIFYMPPFATFTQGRTAVGNAVRELYNSCVNCIEYVEAMNAWSVVGVGQLQNFTTTLVSQNFESNALPFSLYGGMAVFLITGGTLGHNSRGYLQFGGYAGYSGSAVCGPWNLTTIPTTESTLSFWIEMTTTETNLTSIRDTLNVVLRNPTTGALIATLASFSNLSPKNAYSLKTIYGIAAIVGNNPFTIGFEVYNDAANPTIFYIDDLSFTQAQS
jgi:hypothetical protein